MKFDAHRIADALEKCDWSGCPIGNKMILRAAVIELRKRPKSKPHKHYKTEEDVQKMHALASQGLNQKEIARVLGVTSRTVRKFVGRVYQKVAE